MRLLHHNARETAHKEKDMPATLTERYHVTTASCKKHNLWLVAGWLSYAWYYSTFYTLFSVYSCCLTWNHYVDKILVLRCFHLACVGHRLCGKHFKNMLKTSCFFLDNLDWTCLSHHVCIIFKNPNIFLIVV